MRIRNLDELARMSDDEIRSLLRSSRDEIIKMEKRLYREDSDSERERLTMLQIEYCYVKRESEVRRNRHLAHKEFLKRNSNRNENRSF